MKLKFSVKEWKLVEDMPVDSQPGFLWEFSRKAETYSLEKFEALYPEDRTGSRHRRGRDRYFWVPPKVAKRDWQGTTPISFDTLAHRYAYWRQPTKICVDVLGEVERSYRVAPPPHGYRIVTADQVTQGDNYFWSGHGWRAFPGVPTNTTTNGSLFAVPIVGLDEQYPEEAVLTVEPTSHIEKEQKGISMSNEKPSHEIDLKGVVMDSFNDARQRNTFRLAAAVVEEVAKTALGEDYPKFMENPKTRPLAWLALSGLAMTALQVGHGSIPNSNGFAKVAELMMKTSMDDGMKSMVESFIPKMAEMWASIQTRPEIAALLNATEQETARDFAQRHGVEVPVGESTKTARAVTIDAEV